MAASKRCLNMGRLLQKKPVIQVVRVSPIGQDVPTGWDRTAPEYVTSVQVNDVMMADYRALEMRIRNIEFQQNMDKN